ncbi:MAG: DNA topoisomerase IV subunit A [Xanthobacteraceae bacterium]|nr:DNA topoisomerase IV subunit A [Xanthobacteraceae bacterium]MBX3522792.1 DNA topoisomerase IV subunit A [Xanthobacteraceae bacterium]MBX3533063.1 DNA topoisomerase IV subunit A [Xanthobacteraceae bacterium]MBX3550227.1 DNA topoisomerase IV subunit A [Xanthobacteraceae bacterium]MCW5677389.1 DNA topoisomerase IV subunit A [Xanthobacteraceae bacterium]
MTKRIAPPAPGGGGGNIEPVELKEALEERYLSYALSTIMGRALPDARDGLKPVHRRILHAMRQLRLDPGTSFKKSARVVGDVIGKFHPHGDQSVYDALVRLAQDFAQRYPLVDGQGNFGNVDGDNAAAMRYTEARMTDVARLLLEGIDEDAVDMRLTYDGEEQEPIVLPGAFPNLLANGSTGIAVGMATSIPPHNAAEICEAALFLIEKPKCQPRELLKFVKGPDFPTGGIIVDDKATIREAYNTGRGSFRVRARWEQEDTGRGTWVVVVTEIPYSVPKSRLIEKIAELLTDKKLPLLADIRDESTEDVRIVLEPRSRSVDPVLMMEQLFKLTELESRFPLNMNVLMGGLTPRVVNLQEVIREWLDHRREVLIRRSKNRLGIIDHRLEVLGGYLIAYLNLDEVIKIIRTQDEPKPVLMKRFKLSDVQADAILNMRLRNLRKLEEMEIRGEHADLKKEKAELEKLLKSPAGQWKKISDQIKEVRDLFGPKTELGKRRTDFGAAAEVDEAAVAESMLTREPITVVVSEKGWIRALRGHTDKVADLEFKGDDKLKFSFPAETTSKLMVFATNGRFYTLDAGKLPGGRGHGEPIRLMVEIEAGHEILVVFPYIEGQKFLVASHAGKGFVVKIEDALGTTRKGKQVLNVKAPDKATAIAPAGGDHVASIGENRKMLVFPAKDLPEMGRGAGVKLQRYKDGGLSDVKTFNLDEGLVWTDTQGKPHTITRGELRDWRGSRADAGRIVSVRGFPKTNRFRGEV